MIEHTFLANEKGELITKGLSPLKAIKHKCYECSGFNHAEVTRCVCKDCALYPFRKGKSGIKRILTEEQRLEIIERLSKQREK